MAKELIQDNLMQLCAELTRTVRHIDDYNPRYIEGIIIRITEELGKYFQNHRKHYPGDA